MAGTYSQSRLLVIDDEAAIVTFVSTAATELAGTCPPAPILPPCTNRSPTNRPMPSFSTITSSFRQVAGGCSRRCGRGDSEASRPLTSRKRLRDR